MGVIPAPTPNTEATGSQPSQLPAQPQPIACASSSIPLGLGLDAKIKAKVWADELVDFSSLLLSTGLT